MEQEQNKSFTPPRPVTWREKYRVRIGFILGLLFLWRAQPDNIFFLSSGLLVAFLGVFLRQWAAGVVKKMNSLAQSGPYALVRHPLYVGSALIGAGLIWAVTSFSSIDQTLLFWALFWILLDSIYFHKVEREEENLAIVFAQEWPKYVENVPQFLPKKLVFDFSTFSWQVWVHNREWGSILGYVFLSGILIFRYIIGL